MLTIFVHVSHVVQKKRDIFVNSLEKENNTFHSPLKFPRWYHAVVRAWPLHDGDRCMVEARKPREREMDVSWAGIGRVLLLHCFAKRRVLWQAMIITDVRTYVSS
jgi:hypothetical protein